MTAQYFRQGQRGSFLLEAIIGILIFSFGILALVALQANAISAQIDAQYRIEAANFADQILGTINATVGRNASNEVIAANLSAFNHRTDACAGGGVACCNFTGDESANPSVTAWRNAITTGGGLPGATSAMQQIVVDTANSNRVTVVVCWQAPQDPAPRFHRVIAYVN